MLIAMHVPADFSDHNIDVVAYVPRIVTQTFRRAEKLVLAAVRQDQARRVRRRRRCRPSRRACSPRRPRSGRTIGSGRWRSPMRSSPTGTGPGTSRCWSGCDKATKQDVMRVAKELFGERKLVHALAGRGTRKRRGSRSRATPRSSPARGRTRRTTRRSGRCRPSRPSSITSTRPQTIATLSVRDGVTLRANTNPLNDLYHLELRYGIGHDEIRELQLAAQYLRADGERRRIPSTEFRKRLFAISTKLTVTSEEERFIVRIEGPQKHMAAALDLLAALLRQPRGGAQAAAAAAARDVGLSPLRAQGRGRGGTGAAGLRAVRGRGAASGRRSGPTGRARPGRASCSTR